MAIQAEEGDAIAGLHARGTQCSGETANAIGKL